MDLFKGRREAKEIERRVKFKQGKTKVEGYIKKLRKSEEKLLELGKRAHRLGDREQLQHICRSILWTQEQRNRWERYLLQMETMEARRDQVAATGAFVESMKAMTQSMLKGASSKDMSKMQVEMEKALVRAQTLEETMDVVMEVSAESVFSSDVGDDALSEMQSLLGQEAAEDEGEAFDARIAEGLKSIEAELKKD